MKTSIGLLARAMRLPFADTGCRLSWKAFLAVGFVGCMYALCATSLGKPTATTAYYDWFEYSGNDGPGIP